MQKQKRKIDLATAKTTSMPLPEPGTQVGLRQNPGHKLDPAKAQAAKPAGPTTTMVFDSYEHDFGTMDEGDAVTHVFSFTNTGSEPLILDKCKGSCGCTVPQCPKEPIAPGASGEIEVKFNSKGKKNNQTKTVTINANTDPGQTILKIKAFVNPAEAK